MGIGILPLSNRNTYWGPPLACGSPFCKSIKRGRLRCFPFQFWEKGYENCNSCRMLGLGTLVIEGEGEKAGWTRHGDVLLAANHICHRRGPPGLVALEVP